jgi:hypothetical protein
MKRDLGHAIDTFLSVAPQTVGSGAVVETVDGVGKDRLGFEYAVFVFENSKPEGVPLGVTITCKVQDSDDDGIADAYADITGASGVHNVTNTFTRTEVPVDLSVVKKYVKGTMAIQFNGGSGPFAVISALGILGSSRIYPV